MTTAPLRIVAADETPPAAKVETVSERVRRLTAEAKALARDHANAFAAQMVELHAMAAEIHAGGDAYSPGIRSVARDVLLSMESSAQTLAAILGRAS